MNRHINCDEDCAKCGRYTTVGRTRDGRIQYDCFITGKNCCKRRKGQALTGKAVIKLVTWFLIICFAVIIFVVCSLLYTHYGFFKRFFHDGLHWHEPTAIWFDGFQVHSNCKHCGKEIMRDSQGNWFLFKRSEANGQR